MKKLTVILLSALMLISVLAFASCQEQPQNYKQQLLADLKEYQSIDLNSKLNIADGGMFMNGQIKLSKLTLGGQDNLLPGDLVLDYETQQFDSAMSLVGSLALGSDKASLGLINADNNVYINVDGGDNYYKLDMSESEEINGGFSLMQTVNSAESVQSIYNTVLKYAVKFVESIPDTAFDTEDGYKLKLVSSDIKATLASVISDLKADEDLKKLIVDIADQNAYDDFIAKLDEIVVDENDIEITVKENARDDGTDVTEIKMSVDAEELLDIIYTKKGDNRKTVIVIDEEFTLTCEHSATDDGVCDTVDITMPGVTFAFKANSDGKGNLKNSNVESVIDDSAKLTAEITCEDGKISIRAKLYTFESNEFAEIVEVMYDDEQKDGNTTEFTTTVNIKYGGAIIPIAFNGTTVLNDNGAELNATLLCELVGLECNVKFGAGKNNNKVTVPDASKVTDDPDGSALESAFAKLAEDHPELVAFISQFGGLGGVVGEG